MSKFQALTSTCSPVISWIDRKPNNQTCADSCGHTRQELLQCFHISKNKVSRPKVAKKIFSFRDSRQLNIFC